MIRIFFGRSRKRSDFPLQVPAGAVGFPLQFLTCKCALPTLHPLFCLFYLLPPPASGIGLFLLPVRLQALRQAPYPKMYADVCSGSPLLSYPFFQPLFSSLGFAVTERITLCLRNFPAFITALFRLVPTSSLSLI